MGNKLAVLTKESALKAFLIGACRLPEIGRRISDFSTSDLVWAENNGLFTPEEKEKISPLPLWVLSGSGYGYGYGSYWQACLDYFAAKWGREQRERLTALVKAGAKICYWRSTKDATPANGGSGGPVKAGDVQKIAGPLEVCTKRALHGTMIPPKWKGERWWVVALIGEIQGDDEKYGALEREIIGECV